MRTTRTTRSILTAGMLMFFGAARPAASQSSPGMTNPRPGTTLNGSSVTFSWSANGTSVSQWWLYVGTVPGASDLANSGSLSATTYAVTGLPVNGVPVYVRLWYNTGSWARVDYQYRADPGDDVSCPCFTSAQLNALYGQLVARQGKRVAMCIEDDTSSSSGYPPFTHYYVQACVGDICDGNPSVVAAVFSAHASDSTGKPDLNHWNARCTIYDTSNNSYAIYEANLNHREVEVCGNMLKASRWAQDIACQ